MRAILRRARLAMMQAVSFALPSAAVSASWPFAARAWAALLCLLALLAVVGPWLLPHDPLATDWDALSSPPAIADGHFAGTDAIGRDVLVRSLLGLRLSLAIGLLATGLALLLGIAYGAFAGHAGGRTERVMMRMLDVLSALPFLLLVILLLTLFERSLLLLLLAIGGYCWIDLARVLRAEAARLRELPFVLAARACGASRLQILRWHIIPNLMGLALVYASLVAANAILVESFLGFLGLSLDEPASGLGMLLFEGSQELDSAPWTLLVPATLLCVVLAAFQQLGDALRDRLDVRQSARGPAPDPEPASDMDAGAIAR
jgi:oligopeptide transport system permease protein